MLNKEFIEGTSNIQDRVYNNKVNKGFNVDNIEQEILLLIGEVSELYQGILNKDDDNIKEELADINIYLLGISEILGINLGEEVLKKVAINEKRVYYKEGNKIKKIEGDN